MIAAVMTAIHERLQKIPSSDGARVDQARIQASVSRTPSSDFPWFTSLNRQAIAESPRG